MTVKASSIDTVAGVRAVVAFVWRRYNANMAAGKMRQRPGNAEYFCELVNAGLLVKNDDTARRFYFRNSTATDKAATVIRAFSNTRLDRRFMRAVRAIR